MKKSYVIEKEHISKDWILFKIEDSCWFEIFRSKKKKECEVKRNEINNNKNK